MQTGEYKQVISLAIKKLKIKGLLFPLLKARYFILGFLQAVSNRNKQFIFLIYTPGKVGTASIYRACKSAGLASSHTHSHTFARGFYFYFRYLNKRSTVITISGRRNLIDQAISDFCQNIDNKSAFWFFDYERCLGAEIFDHFLKILPIYLEEKKFWHKAQELNIFNAGGHKAYTEGKLECWTQKNLQLWFFNFADITEAFETITYKIFQLTGEKIEIGKHNSTEEKKSGRVKLALKDHIARNRQYSAAVHRLVSRDP